MDPPVIARNPCRKIQLPEDEDQEQRFFTPDEVRQLHETFDGRYKLMVLVGCYGGLRIGEQAGLRGIDVLLGHGQIHVRQGAFEPGAGPVQLGPLKTRYSRGRVDVPRFLLDELAGYLKDHPAAVEGPAKGLVFTSLEGEPLRPRNWRRRYTGCGSREGRAGAGDSPRNAAHVRQLPHRPGAVRRKGGGAGPAPRPRFHLAGVPAPVRAAGGRGSLGRCSCPSECVGVWGPAGVSRGTNVGREAIAGDAGVRARGSKWPLNCGNSSWALLGSNQRPLPCKRWQAQRRYLGKRPVRLMQQCRRVLVSDGWFRLVLVRLGSRWGLKRTRRDLVSGGSLKPPSSRKRPCAQPPPR